MPLSDIVNVQITSDVVNVSRQGFGTAIVVGPNPTFVGRVQYYSDLASIAADLTGGTSDPEYKAAVDAFAQNPRPVQIALGRVDSGDADMTATLDAIKLDSNDWYGLMIVSRTLQDQKDAADWAEANEKIFFIASSDANIVDQNLATDVTSIAWYANSNSLARSAVIYHSSAASEYIDAGLHGKLLPLDPGSYTAMFKTISSVTVDTLNATQSKNALDKKANVYQEIGSVNIVRNGTVADTSFIYIDVIIFRDWLKARITESVYALLASQPKVPYTTNGIAAVKAAVEQPLQIGLNRGGISPFEYDGDGNQIGGYIVTIPALENVPLADKTARVLKEVKFTAWLAGAIHKVEINGVITL